MGKLRTGDMIHNYVVQPEDLCVLANRKITLKDGIYRSLSPDGKRSEVYVPFGDLNVDYITGLSHASSRERKGKEVLDL